MRARSEVEMKKGTGSRERVVLIAAGGTGGHLFPAIAVAEAIRSALGEVRITFVGTGRDVERHIIDRSGFPMIELRARPLKGKSLLYKIRSLAMILPAMARSLLLIRRLRPALVVGAGGYVSGPFVLAAALTTPTLIMEVNLKPGLTTRWLAPFVECVACSFRESVALFGKKGVYTGHPVRPEFFHLAGGTAAAPSREGRPRLLVVGGSQGSSALNRAVIDALPRLKADIVHQTGRGELEAVREAHAKAGSGAVVTAFIDQMAEAFAKADLIISRAGASTISEIAAAGKPSILVPFAAAADNHQEVNARAMERAGAAVVVTEREASTLGERVEELIAAPGRLAAMGAAAESMANPHAAADVAALAVSMMGGESAQAGPPAGGAARV